MKSSIFNFILTNNCTDLCQITDPFQLISHSHKVMSQLVTASKVSPHTATVFLRRNAPFQMLLCSIISRSVTRYQRRMKSPLTECLERTGEKHTSTSYLLRSHVHLIFILSTLQGVVAEVTGSPHSCHSTCWKHWPTNPPSSTTRHAWLLAWLKSLMFMGFQ